MKKFNWYIIKEFLESEGYFQVDLLTFDNVLYFRHYKTGKKIGFEKSNNIGMVMTVIILKTAGLGYNQFIEFKETLKNRPDLEKP